MGLSTLFKTSSRRRRKLNFQEIKNDDTKGKFVINTIVPKFEFKNKEGEIEEPKNGVLF